MMVSGVISPTITPSATRQYFGSPSHPASDLPSKMDVNPGSSAVSGLGRSLCFGTNCCAVRTDWPASPPISEVMKCLRPLVFIRLVAAGSEAQPHLQDHLPRRESVQVVGAITGGGRLTLARNDPLRRDI